ncbi:hypothetical protein ACA601_17125 [Lactiplantibacillus pentosus]|uniref:hypothetical protein n=1 Tax=Lactiplantibacillus pentosus TaxID=1589 RepID=UPI003C1BA257
MIIKDINNDSILDYDVFSRNFEVYKIMSRLPLEDVREILLKSSRCVYNPNLVNRSQKYKQIMQRIKETVPQIEMSKELISKWANYRNKMMLDVILAVLYADIDEYKGAIEDPNNFLKRKSNNIFIYPHYGSYMSIIPIMAANKIDITILMDKSLVSVWEHLLENTSFSQRIHLYGIQDFNTLHKALKRVKCGSNLIMFPEFTLGKNPKLTGEFLNQNVYVPSGPARLACQNSIPLVPLKLKKLNNRKLPNVVLGDDLASQSEKQTITEISLNTMSSMDDIVKKDPSKWWGWQIFIDYMLS